MITSLDELIDAMANRAQPILINKASLSNAVAGTLMSLWRATGLPTQGAIPTAAALCTTATTGAIGFTNPTGGMISYIGRMFLLSANSATDIQVHDRLEAMGGLSGTVTTAQTVGVDITDGALVDRIGAADYSDCQWWLEWYADTGSTAVTATVTYTDRLGNTGKTATVSMSATRRTGMMLPIIPSDGIPIRSVETVQLSATTGTAGNFGVTATRALSGVSLGLANSGQVADWASLGIPRVADNACLELVVIPSTTSTGSLYGTGKLIQG